MEQNRQNDAVGNHLGEGTGQGQIGQRRTTQQHIAHVANGTVSDHPLDIFLGNGGNCSIEDTKRRPNGQVGRKLSPGIGKQS